MKKEIMGTLTSYLSRNEWNIAFFTYFMLSHFDKHFLFPTDLSSHLRTGIIAMNFYGYKNWKGIKIKNLGNSIDDIVKINSFAGNDNTMALIEFLNSDINSKRLDEALSWLDFHKEKLNKFYYIELRNFIIDVKVGETAPLQGSIPDFICDFRNHLMNFSITN